MGFLLYHHRHIEAERALTIGILFFIELLYLYAFNISYFTNEKNMYEAFLCEVLTTVTHAYRHLRKNTLSKQLNLYCDFNLNSSY
ncbi:hypothetical protein ERO13_D03G061501v2 [Gossypium hirsutum]|uniref:Uncharacterized protein n=1 Tax=Gossypium barbadense TaxID=3634 RepID=A0A5J5S1R8_GOSBA|nr:hypothetical protein ES319_D03G079600v1 [Gossypium barbadense]KAG4154718.1 hypothetical protein ERO13_D03G061501v2 [Gossypium hirsutum]